MTKKKEKRLWDWQWVNIVNANNCWEGYTKEEAVHEAVKMAEEVMSRNIEVNGHDSEVLDAMKRFLPVLVFGINPDDLEILV